MIWLLPASPASISFRELFNYLVFCPFPWLECKPKESRAHHVFFSTVSQHLAPRDCSVNTWWDEQTPIVTGLPNISLCDTNHISKSGIIEPNMRTLLQSRNWFIHEAKILEHSTMIDFQVIITKTGLLHSCWSDQSTVKSSQVVVIFILKQKRLPSITTIADMIDQKTW